MFLLSDLISQSRELLQDEVEPYRYDDERLYRTLNNAFAEAYRLRPDIFVDLDFTIPFVTTANSTDTFPLDQQFYNPFVDYVVSMTEFSDDEWTVDGRAMAFLQLFGRRLGVTA
jgi:hypothetical protein